MSSITKPTASSYLGSVLAKQNSQNIPPANALTDFDNTLIRYGYGRVADLSQTCPQFVCVLNLASTSGGLTIPTWWAFYGNATKTNPSNLVRNSAGNITFQLPSTVSNEIDASTGVTNNITISLFAATATPQGSTGFIAQASASGNVINVYTFNSSMTPTDYAGKSVLIVAYGN
jgi:hypothetical protein